MIEKSWKAMWSDHFRMKYAEKAERWMRCNADDRLIFHNTYNMIMRALDSLPDEPDILVKSAMTSKFSSMQTVLDEIAIRFKGR